VLACYTAVGSCGRCFAQTVEPEQQREPRKEINSEKSKDNSLPDGKTVSGTRQPVATGDNRLGIALVKNLARDQKAIWTSPAHIRLGEATWLVPFAGLTAGFLETDRNSNSHFSNSPITLRHYTNFSNYGLAGMAGAGAGLYLLGKVTHDEHKREAGLLSGEAALDGLAVSTALKYATGRERPRVGDFQGRFWKGGDSFPSGHATTVWAIASVLTHEYPGPLTKIFAYGAATDIRG
jgi:membrane-associated phospholipid phosphatase